MIKVKPMELLEHMLEDYNEETEISTRNFEEKIYAGLVYWADLDFQNLEASPELLHDSRINKTGIMQYLLSDLSQLVLKDALTGLFNRRYFQRALEVEIDRNGRDQRPLSLAVLDIDHFKSVNDTWGHDVGDNVLKMVTKIMSKNVRQSDILVRIGGEEFAVIMPNIRHNGARTVMERLRSEIEDLVIPVDGEELRTSVSIGITILDPIHTISSHELYKQADRALYKAKETGRNKVVLHEAPPSTGLSASEREALL